MQELVLDHRMLYFIMAVIVAVMGIQARLLLRMRNILQALAMNSETVVQYVRKIASTGNKKTAPVKAQEPGKKTCQFCKHRLAYIHIPDGVAFREDFYHKCGLQDTDVSLNDTCPLFEEDKNSFEEDKNIFE